MAFIPIMYENLKVVDLYFKFFWVIEMCNHFSTSYCDLEFIWENSATLYK